MLSNPVTLATRVIPITGARRITRFTVCSKDWDRCVPIRQAFGVGPAESELSPPRGGGTANLALLVGGRNGHYVSDPSRRARDRVLRLNPIAMLLL